MPTLNTEFVSPLVALIAGILILLMPRLLNVCYALRSGSVTGVFLYSAGHEPILDSIRPLLDNEVALLPELDIGEIAKPDSAECTACKAG